MTAFPLKLRKGLQSRSAFKSVANHRRVSPVGTGAASVSQRGALRPAPAAFRSVCPVTEVRAAEGRTRVCERPDKFRERVAEGDIICWW